MAVQYIQVWESLGLGLYGANLGEREGGILQLQCTLMRVENSNWQKGWSDGYQCGRDRKFKTWDVGVGSQHSALLHLP